LYLFEKNIRTGKPNLSWANRNCRSTRQ